ncbi:MAG: sodium:solute symporter family protein [Gimesia sp.]
MSTLVLSEIIHEKQTFIACIVIVVYLLMLLALGFVGYLKSKGGEEDYYLAGRDQGWFISSLTIMATFFSSFALLGAPGMVYREGIVFALVSLNVPIAGLSIYLLGGRIWRLGRHRGYVTPADMICDYYGSKVILRLLVAMTGFLFAIPYVMMQIKAGGELSAVLFRDYEHAFEIGCIVLAAIIAVYIMVGGMRSVAWTDAIQCILLGAGIVLGGVAMVVSFGGPAQFSQAISSLPESSLTVPGNTGFWQLPMLFSICVLMPLGGIIQPAQWIRFYSARNLEVLRRGSVLFTVLLTALFLFGITFVGLGGQVLYPLLTAVDGSVMPAAEVGSFDQILVIVINDNLPLVLGETIGWTLASLVVVAIMAAAMSTADSNLHSLAAVATRDIYDRFIRPQASENERVWIGRFVIMAATIFSLFLVLAGRQEGSSLAGLMQMIVALALFAVAFVVQILPLTIDILYIRKGTSWGASVGLLAGLLTAFCFTSLFPPCVDALGWPILHQIQNLVAQCKTAMPMHAMAWGLVPNIALFVLVSLVTPRVPAQRREAFAKLVNLKEEL